MKILVIQFTDTGVKFHKGVDPAPFKNAPNCLINPKIPMGVPPHFWKLEDGKIAVMSDSEMKDRTAAIQEIPIQRNVPIIIRKSSWKQYLCLLLAGVLGAAGFELIKHFLH